MSRYSFFAIAAIVVVAPVSGALATGLSISVATDGVTAVWTEFPSGNPTGTDGVYNYAGGWTNAAGLWQCDWNITAKADPFVSANITFLNSTALPQIYTVTVTQPIAPPIAPTTLIGGSMAGSVTDANFNGLGGVSTVLGSPLYLAMLDATPVLPLYPHLSSFAFAFAGDSPNIPSISAGLPGPTIPSGPVFSSISIQHRFELSPGDSMGITSFFVVTPEPATLALLGLGGLALLRRSRR